MSYQDYKLALQHIQQNESLTAEQSIDTNGGVNLFDLHNFKDTMDVDATSTIANSTAKYVIAAERLVGDQKYLNNLTQTDAENRFKIGYKKLQDYLDDVTKAMMIALLEGNAKRTTNLSSDALEDKRAIFYNTLKKDQFKDTSIKPWNNWRDTHSTVNISSVLRTNNVVTVTTTVPHNLDTNYDDWGAIISINNSEFDISSADHPNGVPIILTGSNTFTYAKSGADVQSTSVVGTADIKIGWGGNSNNLHLYFT